MTERKTGQPPSVLGFLLEVRHWLAETDRGVSELDLPVWMSEMAALEMCPEDRPSPGLAEFDGLPISVCGDPQSSCSRQMRYHLTGSIKHG
jgi:hypothetical protein